MEARGWGRGVYKPILLLLIERKQLRVVTERWNLALFIPPGVLVQIASYPIAGVSECGD